MASGMWSISNLNKLVSNIVVGSLGNSSLSCKHDLSFSDNSATSGA